MPGLPDFTISYSPYGVFRLELMRVFSSDMLLRRSGLLVTWKRTLRMPRPDTLSSFMSTDCSSMIERPSKSSSVVSRLLLCNAPGVDFSDGYDADCEFFPFTIIPCCCFYATVFSVAVVGESHEGGGLIGSAPSKHP